MPTIHKTLIDGREYTTDEIRAIYEYQKREYQKEDIRYGIECAQVQDCYSEEEEERARWLCDPANAQAVFEKACSYLERWNDIQNEILSANFATIAMLTEELANEEMYK